MEHMKLVRAILILSALVLVLLLILAPCFVDSRPLARAIVAFRYDPSPKNKSELELQQKIVRMVTNEVRFRARIFLAGLLAANSLSLYFVSRHIQLHGRLAEPGAPGNSR